MQVVFSPGTASSVRPDGQAASAQAHQQDLLGDLLDLNDPEPAPAAAAPPPAASNNGVQDLLGGSACITCKLVSGLQHSLHLQSQEYAT